MSQPPLAVPQAVNLHLTRACNARCTFCFATFRDVAGSLTTEQRIGVLALLRAAGVSKVTFVGGEPTLLPDLGLLVNAARSLGLTTCVVTNGFRLDALLDRHGAALDWVGLSVDTADEGVQAALGRGRGDHVRRAVRHAERCHDLGIRVKLNTVVTALNVHHDLADLVRAIRPARWKVFQVLPIEGQNDGSVEPLLISAGEFDAFLDRHAHLAAEGFAAVPEGNEAMRGSYAMVDPEGRFFGNATGRHVTSRPILEVGVEAAFSEVGFEEAKFLARGGLYAW